ncbi:auxilin-like protein SWA2 SCDLUD_004579 [Saccharomycodes ludwigii]|uniref:auxilin-like protein SWA2 n=1 Tax=Saccharomycodes ludwigii TaxID=36035 RepID=UPI001E86BB9F|nr:hypothetical protein SCDLUD_004579 [Saccharomycodes ludwigii]KAH3899151.1 hypothetical protein SCDLUD_004579 [Saccharomycodes ludwigii]
MSADPFSDLLNSFKDQHNTVTITDNDKNNSSDINSKSLNHLLKQKELPNKNTPVQTNTLAETSTNVTNTVDLLDDFFGSSSNTNISTSTKNNNQTNNDSGSDLLEDFLGPQETSPNNNAKSLQPEHMKEEYVETKEKEQEQEQENIADEVKDFELARLMSINDMSLNKALEYYENGITYDVLMKKLKPTYPTRTKTSNTLSSGVNNDAVPPSIIEETSSNLFNIASSLFNKGKNLIEQSLNFEDENERYNNNSRDTANVNSFAKLHINSNINSRLDALKQNFDDSSVLTSNTNRPIRMGEKSKHLYVENNKNNQANSDTTTIDNFNSTLLIDRDDNISSEISSDNIKRNNLTEKSTSQQPLPASSESNILLDFSNDSFEQTSLHQGNNIKSNHNQPYISDLEYASYTEFKEKAAIAFKNGDYTESLNDYIKSLNSLPENHPLRIISLSNIVTTRLKLGETSKSLENANAALKLLELHYGNATASPEETIPKSDGKRYKDMWGKIVFRKAEILESMDNYKAAYDLYKTLVSTGITDLKIMQGKSRCEKVVLPQNKTVLSSKNPKLKASTGLNPSVTNSNSFGRNENLKRVQDKNFRLEQLERENFQLHDQIEQQVQDWCKGHETDLRYLLLTLSKVLQFSSWPEIKGTDLVMPKRVKIYYLKAISKTHPDKLNDSLSTKDKMLASSIFIVLTKSWELFKQDNNL